MRDDIEHADGRAEPPYRLPRGGRPTILGPLAGDENGRVTARAGKEHAEEQNSMHHDPRRPCSDLDLERNG